jgi:lysozyme family protein
MTPDDLITEIIDREGRQYTNRPADKGGPTKFGITQLALSHWRGRAVTPADVEALTEGEARQIYLKEYVQRWGFDGISDPLLQALMVDWSVTSGPDNPTKALQKILHIPIDGAIGPRTRAAYAISDKRSVYVSMVRARVVEMLNEAMDDGDVQSFLRLHPKADLNNVRGWVNRALEFVL